MNHSEKQPVGGGCVAESGQPRRIKYFVRQAAIKLSISAALYGRRILHRPTLTNVVTNLKGKKRETERERDGEREMRAIGKKGEEEGDSSCKSKLE